ncbi:translation elongation factor Ts [Castellaniella defragrans]|uniref:Elongation factor Ts n=2 Tax=Castellaniella defragrans TaxID=75697 RepID=W8X3V9_CASD6|nr:translation elongation factor Ts [Castellaniella defragrans]KAB0604870.1 elongation factor Ts [Castellaniella defragrans]MBB6084341.1 elongation factor Ts [Castellaniella defragrans]CDM24437.1 Translation elongation factor Ts [Castellaniella defragrans 65Phen]
MAQITAAMVKELREKTDAPMMECKKALTEAEGDLARAEELLRVKLGSKASKAAGRITAEGLVGLHIAADGKSGALVEVNCETDFVAKNDDFIAFVNDLARIAAERNPADLAALNACAMGDGTVESVRAALVGKIGENMSVRRFQRFDTVDALNSYVHGGRIGVLVDYAGADEVGKDLAMHIAATKPRALNADGVDPALIAAERSVAEQKAAESGKPAEIVAKMVEGSVQKFLKEVTLLSQPFVKNDKQTVEQMLKEKGARINRYALFVVGEGIEKKSEDFAAEVAAAASGS